MLIFILTVGFLLHGLNYIEYQFTYLQTLIAFVLSFGFGYDVLGDRLHVL